MNGRSRSTYRNRLCFDAESNLISYEKTESFGKPGILLQSQLFPTNFKARLAQSVVVIVPVIADVVTLPENALAFYRVGDGGVLLGNLPDDRD